MGLVSLIFRHLTITTKIHLTITTKIHFSRMCTACLLTVSCCTLCSTRDGYPHRGHTIPEVPSPRGGHSPPWHTYPSQKGHGTRDTHPPPVNSLTDTCENITFQQLLLRAVTINGLFITWEPWRWRRLQAWRAAQYSWKILWGNVSQSGCSSDVIFSGCPEPWRSPSFRISAEIPSTSSCKGKQYNKSDHIWWQKFHIQSFERVFLYILLWNH